MAELNRVHVEIEYAPAPPDIEAMMADATTPTTPVIARADEPSLSRVLKNGVVVQTKHSIGTIWLDTGTLCMHQFNGEAWVEISQ